MDPIKRPLESLWFAESFPGKSTIDVTPPGFLPVLDTKDGTSYVVYKACAESFQYPIRCTNLSHPITYTCLYRLIGQVFVSESLHVPAHATKYNNWLRASELVKQTSKYTCQKVLKSHDWITGAYASRDLKTFRSPIVSQPYRQRPKAGFSWGAPIYNRMFGQLSGYAQNGILELQSLAKGNSRDAS